MNTLEAVQNANLAMLEARETGGHSPMSLGREEGIPWVWISGGALMCILAMVGLILGIIVFQGVRAFWPREIVAVTVEGSRYVGFPVRTEKAGAEKTLFFVGNQDLGHQDFIYVSSEDLNESQPTTDIWFVERREWGPFLGSIAAVRTENKEWAIQGEAQKALPEAIAFAEARREAMTAIEEDEISVLNNELESTRLHMVPLQRQGDIDSAEMHRLEQKQERLQQTLKAAIARLQALRSQDGEFTVRLRAADGTEKEVATSAVVRAFPASNLTWTTRFSVFMSRIGEFLSEKPREANTAGGVFPALFGTVIMTLLMTVAVLPFGVITAVFIREIARQGLLVSLIRIAVSNLAGVPSIVYGIFGMGFFCYTLGASIDQLLFSEKLPNPTFGTGGILWASLTLALLTVPVVIVSTEEALSAVPRSLREGSLGCGATRLQTLLRIVLPKAAPGIMTGMILAMARGMGEVAPLILTGVVKLAPDLPVDGRFPFVHLERSFMHLGFHIYDLGFQSRSSEASRPMVFASTLLLILLVLLLNLLAIWARQRLRKRFEGRGAF